MASVSAWLPISRLTHRVCFVIGPMRDVSTAAILMEATVLCPTMHLFLSVCSAIQHSTTS